MNCSTPGLPVHHQLPEFTQTPRVGREWELTWGQDFPEPQLSWEREKVTSLGMMGYLNYTQEFLWKAMEAKAALSDFSWSSKGKER